MSSHRNQAKSVILPALANIPRRAERNTDEILSSTFVALGSFFDHLATRENQIIVGRRGTGKTHALSYLGQELRTNGEIAIDIDLRTVGSAGGFFVAAPGNAAGAAADVIVDFLEAIHSELYTISLRLLDGEHDVTSLVRSLDAFGEAASATVIEGAITATFEGIKTLDDETAARLGISPSGIPIVEFGSKTNETNSTRTTDERSGVERPALKMRQLSTHLNGIVEHLPSHRLWILIDEWSALPPAIQVILADFIRRCILPCKGVTLKIAAVERRSVFKTGNGAGYLGLELGADITQDLDLDSYLTEARLWEGKGIDFYRSMLSRHIREFQNERGEHVELNYVQRMLVDAIPAFHELVVAAGGIPRDTLNIASLAAQAADPHAISRDYIYSAARRWFVTEKEAQVRNAPGPRRVLNGLRVLAEKGTNRFLLTRDWSSRNDDVLELLDQRVVHLLARAVGPGARYDAFAIDLGLYADLLSPAESLPATRDPWGNWQQLRTDTEFAPILDVAALQKYR